jgi:Zn-dependent protease with chaperone function
VVPIMATGFGLEGHAVGDAAALVPAVALLLSLGSVVLALSRAARRVRRLVATARAGPAGSLLVPDGEVLIAAAGLRRPHVLVSAGALAVLDDEELAASLDHERGHIARRHRYALVAGELCRGLARPLPGTDAAARELAFHLERDADRFAVAHEHAPAALATAICKAARGHGGVRAPGAALSGSPVVRRVEQLLEAPMPRTRRTTRPLQALVATMLGLVVMLAVALPVTAVTTTGGQAPGASLSHCPAA